MCFYRVCFDEACLDGDAACPRHLTAVELLVRSWKLGRASSRPAPQHESLRALTGHGAPQVTTIMLWGWFLRLQATDKWPSAGPIGPPPLRSPTCDCRPALSRLQITCNCAWRTPFTSALGVPRTSSLREVPFCGGVRGKTVRAPGVRERTLPGNKVW